MANRDFDDDFEDNGFIGRSGESLDTVKAYFVYENLDDPDWQPIPEELADRFGVPARVIKDVMKKERWKYLRLREVTKFNKSMQIERKNEPVIIDYHAMQQQLLAETIESCTSRLPKVIQELDMLLESGDMSEKTMIQYLQILRDERDKTLTFMQKLVNENPSNVPNGDVAIMGATADLLEEKIKAIRAVSGTPLSVSEQEYDQERAGAFDEYN